MNENHSLTNKIVAPHAGARKPAKPSPRLVNVLLVVAAVAAAAMGTARLIASNGVQADAAAVVAPAAVDDLNDLSLYRASEWGDAAAPAYDLNALTAYRASEWGDAAAPAYDLNALTAYRASEWGDGAAGTVVRHIIGH